MMMLYGNSIKAQKMTCGEIIDMDVDFIYLLFSDLESAAFLTSVLTNYDTNKRF